MANFYKTTNTKRSNMKTSITTPGSKADGIPVYSKAEKIERRALGLPACKPAPSGIIKRLPKDRKLAAKKAISEPKVLNEAPEYGAAFVRGLRVDQPVKHFILAISAPNSGVPITTSRGCSLAKVPPGMISSAPPATCATLSATTTNSTLCAMSSSAHWG